MMTSTQIRQSFLDFFASKQHAIVPSSSLMPTAPNLLFTNAGMNQFVPYFLGDQAAPWKRVTMFGAIEDLFARLQAFYADRQAVIRSGVWHLAGWFVGATIGFCVVTELAKRLQSNP